jgi:ABC-type phosphate/phosphonate transport system substrate-binding protein
MSEKTSPPEKSFWEVPIQKMISRKILMSTKLKVGKLALRAMVVAAGLFLANSARSEDLVCWFVPGSDGAKCKAITEALTKESGVGITPRVAANYPEIFKALSEKKDALVYTGSFATALLISRNLVLPLVQKIDGKELYCGVLIYPKGGDPAAILSGSPADVSYAIGASSGESTAKAATGGKASIGVKDHMAAANALKAGKAKAAVVKNYWWDANKDKFPDFQMYEIPGISIKKCPDNLLLASSSVKPDVCEKIVKAAVASKDAFGATSMDKFDAATLSFPLELMSKGGIDAKTYAW